MDVWHNILCYAVKCCPAWSRLYRTSKYFCPTKASHCFISEKSNARWINVTKLQSQYVLQLKERLCFLFRSLVCVFFFCFFPFLCDTLYIKLLICSIWGKADCFGIGVSVYAEVSFTAAEFKISKTRFLENKVEC